MRPSTIFPLLLALMGLIAPAEVPDFYLLRNLTPAGRDAQNRPLIKADRLKITVEDVIAAEGPRSPDVYHSQRKFNTGVVVLTEHNQAPTRELLDRAQGIAKEWAHYWSITTGGRSEMTTIPK